MEPGRPLPGTPPEDAALVERVKRAMLAMQRAPWEQGVAAQALLELGEPDWVVLMAREALARQDGEGRLAMLYTTQAVTDPAACGEAVLFAAKATGDPAFQEGADRMLDYLLVRAPRTPGGVLCHTNDACQVWADSMYMAPPFLAVAGRPELALAQVEGIRSLLWDPARRLFSHQWDEGRKAFARRAFWGVGNGWCAAGMARVHAALPAAMEAERSRLASHIQDVLDGCLVHQRPDSLFHDVLDDPSSFVETNLAQMLAYTIYRGVREGWLDRACLVQAESMRRAARAKVDASGLVQGVCGAPEFDRPGTAAEGQAFFILMEAARRGVSGSGMPTAVRGPGPGDPS